MLTVQTSDDRFSKPKSKDGQAVVTSRSGRQEGYSWVFNAALFLLSSACVCGSLSLSLSLSHTHTHTQTQTHTHTQRERVRERGGRGLD